LSSSAANPPVLKPTQSQPQTVSIESNIQPAPIKRIAISEHSEHSFPVTPMPTPNLSLPGYRILPAEYPIPRNIPSPESSVNSESDMQQIFSQLQIEQQTHELTRKKLDYFAEEKALYLKEIAANRSQIENLNNLKHLMSQSLEQNSQNQSKIAQELSKRQQILDQEKLLLQKEIEKEKTAELELSLENSQLQTKLESLNESFSVLANEKPFLVTTYENEKNIRIHLETEYYQLKERFGLIQKELDKERTENVSLAKDVQDLKKQAKALESTSSSTEELTTKIQLLEQQLNDEQFKRNDIEVRFVDLHLRYSELYSQYSKQFQIIADTLTSIKQKLASFPPGIQTHNRK